MCRCSPHALTTPSAHPGFVQPMALPCAVTQPTHAWALPCACHQQHKRGCRTMLCSLVWIGEATSHCCLPFNQALHAGDCLPFGTRHAAPISFVPQCYISIWDCKVIDNRCHCTRITSKWYCNLPSSQWYCTRTTPQPRYTCTSPHGSICIQQLQNRTLVSSDSDRGWC